MGAHGQGDKRASRVVNAALVLVLALIPLLGSVQPRAIDRSVTPRPWGCRTCAIPAPLVPTIPDAPGL